MRLLISDPGNLGCALEKECQQRRVPFAWYGGTDGTKHRGNTIGVYVGRGRRFDEFHAYCAEHGRIPILQCSSDVRILTSNTPIYDVPNASSSVRFFIDSFKQLVQRFEREGVGITWRLTETHQAGKTSPPRTAQILADIGRIEPKNVTSIRVSPEHHAKFFLEGTVLGTGEKIELCCKVQGLQPYALGIIGIASALDKEIRAKGLRDSSVYTVADIGS